MAWRTRRKPKGEIGRKFTSFVISVHVISKSTKKKLSRRKKTYVTGECSEPYCAGNDRCSKQNVGGRELGKARKRKKTRASLPPKGTSSKRKTRWGLNLGGEWPRRSSRKDT